MWEWHDITVIWISMFAFWALVTLRAVSVVRAFGEVEGFEAVPPPNTVRLTFRREATVACPELVSVDRLGMGARMRGRPPVAVAPVLARPGEHAFACQTGMYGSTLVVE